MSGKPKINQTKYLISETFVDHAEEIWSMLAEGMTQQQVADEIRWSRGKVADYALLENLCPNCWDLIVAEFQNIATIYNNTDATKAVATATITENILRPLRPLTEFHQLKIIQDLIAGNRSPWAEHRGTLSRLSGQTITSKPTLITKGRFFCFWVKPVLSVLP